MSTTYYNIKNRSDPHVPDPPCTQKTKHETHHTQAQSRKKLGRQQISARSSWVKVVDTSAMWWPTFGSTSLGGLLHRDWKCERTQPFPGEAPLACGNSSGLSALIRQWNILRKLLCHLVSNLLVNHLGLEHPQPVSSRVHGLSHQSRHGTTKVWTAPSHSAGVTIVTWSASPTTAPHGCSYKVQDRQWTGWRNSWNCCFAFTTACSCLYSLSTTAIHSTTSRSGWHRCRSFGGTLLHHHHTAPRKGLHRKRFYKLEVSKKKLDWRCTSHVFGLDKHSCFTLLSCQRISSSKTFANSKDMVCCFWTQTHAATAKCTWRSSNWSTPTIESKQNIQAMMKCNFHSHLRIAAVCS